MCVERITPGIQERWKHVFVLSPRYCTTSPYWALTRFNLCLQWLRFLAISFSCLKRLQHPILAARYLVNRSAVYPFFSCPSSALSWFPLVLAYHLFGLNIRVNVVNWYDLQYRVFYMVVLLYYSTWYDDIRYTLSLGQKSLLRTRRSNTPTISSVLFVSARTSHTCVNDESYYRHLHWQFRSVVF